MNAEETNRNSSSTRKETLKEVKGVLDLCPLIGFTLRSLDRVDGDGIYAGFNNGRNVAVDLLYNGHSLLINEPYGVDSNGHRVDA